MAQAMGSQTKPEFSQPRRGDRPCAHTFVSLYTHVIFSTEDRLPLLTAELRPDLLAYMGGINRKLDGKVMEANARPDHIQCLLSLPPALAIAGTLRGLKTNSSAWVHETRRRAAFAWQTGYGAFSVSQSNIPAMVKYVRNQDQHHRRVTFQEEFIAFLKRHGIEYDERYI
jgi:putative transposase